MDMHRTPHEYRERESWHGYYIRSDIFEVVIKSLSGDH